MPDKKPKKTTDQEIKDVSAGAAFEPETAPSGPGGGGGGGQQDPSWQSQNVDDVDASNVDAGAAEPKDIGPSGPGGGGSDGGPDFQQIDPQNIDAGADRPRDYSASGPGGGDSSDDPGQSFQPQQINPDNVDAGAAQPMDISSGGGGGGGGPDSQSSPLFTPTPTVKPDFSQIDEGEASDIAAGATAPPDLGPDSGEDDPGNPSVPSIKVKVQDTDLIGGPPNADG
jgi:hypothetical protein